MNYLLVVQSTNHFDIHIFSFDRVELCCVVNDSAMSLADAAKLALMVGYISQFFSVVFLHAWSACQIGCICCLC